MRESAGGLGEWRSEIVRTVQEFRVVAVPSDAIVVGHPFVGIGAALGNNGGFAGKSEGREIGRHGQMGRTYGVVIKSVSQPLMGFCPNKFM